MRFDVRYEYDLNGTTHSGDRVAFGDYGSSFSSHAVYSKILALRQQLAVFNKEHPRLKLRFRKRVFRVGLRRVWSKKQKCHEPSIILKKAIETTEATEHTENECLAPIDGSTLEVKRNYLELPLFPCHPCIPWLELPYLG